MARPTTKKDLIIVANEQYDKLWEIINSMNDEDQRKDFTFDKETAGKEAHWKRDNNARDILIHLYEWHQLLLNWVASNQKGESATFLPSPYNWKTYGDMNVGFWEKHQNTSYEMAVENLKESHQKVMALIETFSNEELFSKKHFDWIGTSTLGSYCVSATSSHYDWAMKKLKKHLKSI
jgi:Uncharacterized conserved protein